MKGRHAASVAASLAALATLAASALARPALGAAGLSEADAQRVRYADLTPSIARLWPGEREFDEYLRSVDADAARRVVEGDREHLIYYALQSRTFTHRPPIEPALSSQRFVNALPPDQRDRFLADESYLPRAGWPVAERARVADLMTALGRASTDARLAYVRRLSAGESRVRSPDALYPDYARVARFLYRKEFVAAQDASEVSHLYERRGFSSDTAIEAGYGVYAGLGTLRALEPGRRIQRVLIVGPGLDVAPRTALVDVVAPQSYQPFAVADALIALSLASESELRIHAIDINPRVVEQLRDVARQPVTLHFFSAVADTADAPFSDGYRAYVRALGRAIGDAVSAPAPIAADRRYQHSVAVRPAITRAIAASRSNVIVERAAGEVYDLAIATNVLAYFDNLQLALALSNIAAMLRPGGYLLHNESRGGLAELAASADLPIVQMRTEVIGGPARQLLYDSVWLHKRAAGAIKN